jgi:hypothetical protein
MYTYFSATDAPSRALFIADSETNGIAQFINDEDLTVWVLGGLEYEGGPGTLGTWTTYPSDLQPGFWSVRNPAGQRIAFASNQALAEVMVDAMTNYPVEPPG